MAVGMCATYCALSKGNRRLAQVTNREKLRVPIILQMRHFHGLLLAGQCLNDADARHELKYFANFF